MSPDTWRTRLEEEEAGEGGRGGRADGTGHDLQFGEIAASGGLVAEIRRLGARGRGRELGALLVNGEQWRGRVNGAHRLAADADGGRLVLFLLGFGYADHG